MSDDEDFEIVQLPGMGNISNNKMKDNEFNNHYDNRFNDDDEDDNWRYKNGYSEKYNSTKDEIQPLSAMIERNESDYSDGFFNRKKENNSWNYLNNHRGTKIHRKTMLNYMTERNKDFNKKKDDSKNYIQSKLLNYLENDDTSDSNYLESDNKTSQNDNFNKNPLKNSAYESLKYSPLVVFDEEEEEKKVTSQLNDFFGYGKEEDEDLNTLEYSMETKSRYSKNYPNDYSINMRRKNSQKYNNQENYQNDNQNQNGNSRYLRSKLSSEFYNQSNNKHYSDNYQNSRHIDDYNPGYSSVRPFSNNVDSTNNDYNTYSNHNNYSENNHYINNNSHEKYSERYYPSESSTSISNYNNPSQPKYNNYPNRQELGTSYIQNRKSEDQNKYISDNEEDLNALIEEKGYKMLQSLKTIDDKAKNDVLHILLDGEWHNEKELIRIAKKSRYIGNVSFGMMMHSFSQLISNKFLLKILKSEAGIYYKIHDNFIGLTRAAFTDYKE